MGACPLRPAAFFTPRLVKALRAGDLQRGERVHGRRDTRCTGERWLLRLGACERALRPEGTRRAPHWGRGTPQTPCK